MTGSFRPSIGTVRNECEDSYARSVYRREDARERSDRLRARRALQVACLAVVFLLTTLGLLALLLLTH